MICPICKLELKDSMIVLNLNAAGIKEFHLRFAHYENFMAECYSMLSAMSWKHRELKQSIAFGEEAVKLYKLAGEIHDAELVKWDGEK